jgi:hypothetical protein
MRTPSGSLANRQARRPLSTLLFRSPGWAMLIMIVMTGLAWAGQPDEKPYSDEWLRQALSNIQRADDVFASDERGGFTATNHAHGLRSVVSSQGLQVSLGTQAQPSWDLGIGLVAYGREGRLTAIAPVEPVSEGRRVELRRAGITEWYVNAATGLEQGFTLMVAPTARDGRDRLVVEMSVHTGLSARLSEDRRSLDFTGSSGETVVRYAGLMVVDAAGRTLPSDLDFSAGRLRIRVQDHGARFPITIDPIVASPPWTGESDLAGARFGVSVATAGDVNCDGYSDVVIGAYLYNSGDGRVFIYYGSSTGLPSTPSTERHHLSIGGSNFGVSVASAGDTDGDGCDDIIVGANLLDHGSTDEGAAFVYFGSHDGLGSTPWTVESDKDNSELGISVAGAGDVNGDGRSDIIIGAHRYKNLTGSNREGHAFIYLGAADKNPVLDTSFSGWVNQDNARYGSSVASAGDVNGDGYDDVIVGAHFYDNGSTNEGGAFVYLGSSSGVDSNPDWQLEGNLANAEFGVSVSTAGDVNGDGYSDVIVGADHFTNSPGNNEGRAFVFHGSATPLDTTADWTAEIDQNEAHLGYSVATAGDINGDGFADVIVGAHSATNGDNDEGRAFLWLGGPGGLGANGTVANADWTGESDQNSSEYGISVATAGDVNGDGYSDILVGAMLFDHGESNEGRAFSYRGSASGLSPTTAWTYQLTQAGAQLGGTVAAAGDVNGDGFGDLIVGAPLYHSDWSQPAEGAMFLFYGSPAGPSTTPDWQAEANVQGAELGYLVGAAGDVNGDGYSDIFAWAPGYTNGEYMEGGVFIWYGGATGLGASGDLTNFDWKAESNQANAAFGASAGTAGDVNGDGVTDFIVGAPTYDNGHTDEGEVFLWLGSSSGLGSNGTPANADWTAQSDQAGAQLGISLRTAGDVDRNGYSDVIVGAHLYDNTQTDEGRVFVYLGSSSGLGSTPWTAESNQDYANFGQSVDTAGDLNGDGYSDILVGAPLFDNGHTDEGEVFAYYGSSSGLVSGGGTPTNANWKLQLNVAYARFGLPVATAGDVNGDGFSDVIIGAFLMSNGQSNEGRAFAYLGGASEPATYDWSGEADQANAAFGLAISTAGDSNGDGFSDVVIGAPGFDYSLDYSDTGKTYLYYGNGQDGLDRAVRQARNDYTPGSAAPADLLGLSGESSSFRILQFCRTPIGRGKIRMQWEVKPLSSAFDGSSLQVSTTTDTGAPNNSPFSLGSRVELNWATNNLSAATLYHWRVRVLTNSPLFPRSPWFSLPLNGPNEADIRTNP